MRKSVQISKHRAEVPARRLPNREAMRKRFSAHEDVFTGNSADFIVDLASKDTEAVDVDLVPISSISGTNSFLRDYFTNFLDDFLRIYIYIFFVITLSYYNHHYFHDYFQAPP